MTNNLFQIRLKQEQNITKLQLYDPNIKKLIPIPENIKLYDEHNTQIYPNGNEFVLDWSSKIYTLYKNERQMFSFKRKLDFQKQLN